MSTYEHSPLPWKALTPEALVNTSNGTMSIACDESGESAEQDLANAEFIVRACNSHAALLDALQECSFRLATLIAASGDFSEVNAKALDMATAALVAAQER